MPRARRTRVVLAALAATVGASCYAVAGCGEDGQARVESKATTDAPSSRPNGPAGTTFVYERVQGYLAPYRLGGTEPFGALGRGPKGGLSVRAFRPVTSVFTVDSQTRDRSQVVEVESNRVKTLATSAPGRPVYPFAASGSVRLFLQARHGVAFASPGATAIVRLERDGAFTAYPHIAGASQGVVSGDRLFYTAFPRRGSTYDLYETSVSNPSERPRLIRHGIASDEIYALNGRVYTYDDGQVSGPAGSFRCQSFDRCEFDDESDVFVQVKIDSDGPVGDGDSIPVIEVTDVASRRRIATVREASPFVIRDGVLTAYGDHGITRVPLR